MGVYGAGWPPLAALTGNEKVLVDNGGATNVAATTGQIANLSGSGFTQDILNTSITTVGAGTLTAAALLGGLITRTGPVAAYTDTTDTAAAIVALLGTLNVGATFNVIIKNATAFTQTLAAGTGVTLPSTVLIGPFQEGEYYGVIGGTAAVPTVVFNHVLTTAIALAPSVVGPETTTLNTVGAGTVLAAAINSGATLRTGSQSGTAFTDTTDIATAIIAGNEGLVGKIGTSFVYYYANTTNALATLGGGTGVTVSQGALATTALIPQGMTAGFILTYTAAATITMVCFGLTSNTAPALALAGSTSGQAQLAASAVAGNTVATLPAVTGVLASTSGTDLYIADLYRCTTIQTANANVVPATVTGLVSNTLPIGTYRIRLVLYTTVASGTAGINISGLLTTAVLGVGDFVTKAFLAATMSTAGATSVTSPITLYNAATIPIEINVEGTFTVTTAGTLTIQMCQNTSNASNSSVNVGSYMELVRIA